MNKEVKKKWVAALRSGKYKQGHGMLRKNKGNDARFCCLGVLCNLHAEAHPEIAAKQTSRAKYMGRNDFLPEAVKKWAGLKRVNPEVDVGERYLLSLAELNDQGRDFKFIADVIEEQL